MLFSEKDKPRKEGGLFKKFFVLFNLLMLANVLTLNHIEAIQDRKPAQEVADLGGDKHDFVNQQERALSNARANSNVVSIVESDLDKALLGFVAEHNQLYSLLNTHRYTIWIAGVLLFFAMYRLSRRT